MYYPLYYQDYPADLLDMIKMTFNNKMIKGDCLLVTLKTVFKDNTR